MPEPVEKPGLRIDQIAPATVGQEIHKGINSSSTFGEANMGTKIDGLGDLREKAPEVYKKMIDALMRNMLRQIANFPDRLKRARRS